jgi:hypothetical protein
MCLSGAIPLLSSGRDLLKDTVRLEKIPLTYEYGITITFNDEGL